MASNFTPTLDNLENLLSGLVGPKTAQRLTLALVTRDPEKMIELIALLEKVRKSLGICSECGNIHENESEQLCNICLDLTRANTIMVVESVQELFTIENTGAYKGKYHVLNGLVSAIKGKTLGDLNCATLLPRVSENKCDELIFALPNTMDGEITAALIKESLPEDVRCSHLARGVPSGANLEYIDSATLRISIQNRS